MKAKRITVVKASDTARLSFVGLFFLFKISIISIVRRAYERKSQFILGKLLSIKSREQNRE